MAALKARLTADEHKALAEPLQANYKADGETFVLDIEGGIITNEDPGALKRALERTREELGAAKKAADAVKDIDPEKYKQMVARIQQIETREREEQGRYSEIIASQRTDFEKQISELNTRYSRDVGQRDNTIAGLIADHAATAALTANKGSVSLLLPHVRQFVRVNRNDKTEQYEMRVVDPVTGDTLLSKRTGQPHTVDSFVGEEMREDARFARAFEGTGASGSGARGAGAGAGNGAVGAIRLTREQAKDRPTYLAAQKRANETGVPLIIETANANEGASGGQ